MSSTIHSRLNRFDKAAINTLTAAFFDDPVVGYLLPAPKLRKRWLHAGMETLLGLALKDGHAYVYRDAESPALGALGVFPPGSRVSGLTALKCLLRATLRNRRLDVPVRTAIRMLRLLALLDEKHMRDPHWYILVIGVHPEKQGRGISRKLLEPILKQADEQSVPCYLESSNPSNIPVYRKFGFQILEEFHPPLKGCPPIWLMHRAPTVASANPATEHP